MTLPPDSDGHRLGEGRGVNDLLTWLPEQFDEDEREAHRLDHMPACGFSGECDCLLAERKSRALREVDAKRRILDDCESYIRDGYEAVTDGLAGRTVAALALPYADRPGYRDEWRPEVTGGQ